MLDLFVLLVKPRDRDPWDQIRPLAIKLGGKLIAHTSVAERAGRIAWLEAQPTDQQGLATSVIDSDESRLRRPPELRRGRGRFRKCRR
jgi:hypothetical protein